MRFKRETIVKRHLPSLSCPLHFVVCCTLWSVLADRVVHSSFSMWEYYCMDEVFIEPDASGYAIPFSSLTIKKPLGSSTSGIVWAGRMNSQPVAIKQLLHMRGSSSHAHYGHIMGTWNIRILSPCQEFQVELCKESMAYLKLCELSSKQRLPSTFYILSPWRIATSNRKICYLQIQ